MEESTGVQEVSETTTAPEESPTSEAQVDTESEAGTASKSQNRYQKLANENRQYKMELQKFREEQAALAGARNLDAILRANPHKAAKIMEIINAREEAQVRADPYAAFSPEVAAKFREMDELKQWREQWEENQKSQQVKTFEKNKAALETEYASLLQKDGYVGKDGNPVSQPLVDAIDRATLAMLMETAEDPNFPTSQELNRAYGLVIAGFKEAEKRGLKQTIKSPGVPASGTKSGTIPAKGPETDQQRINRILSEL